MEQTKNGTYLLETKTTAYAFRVRENGWVEHVYYGAKLPKLSDYDAVAPTTLHAPGNGAVIGNDCLEDALQEAASRGWGDLREPLVDCECPGGNALLFTFASCCEVEKAEPEGLPCAFGGGETVCLTLKEKTRELFLEIYYTLYPEEDVIARFIRLRNETGEPVTVRRLLSQQLDLPAGDYRLSTFRGAWVREMERVETPVAGKQIWDSRAGVSSNRCNPFAMVYDAAATEEYGRVYGCNLLYSGNHFGCVECSAYDSVHIVQGMGDLAWTLASGDSLDSPQAILTFSKEGFTGMSDHMHAFIRKHVVSESWQEKERPVLVNSWEAIYFHVSHKKIVSLAKAAKEIGAELLVLDDGWFRGRDNDTKALGDWTPDLKKLPKGLEGLSDEVRAMGLQFGLWVEPEMVSEDSDLFRRHPDWILGHKDQAIGRNQYVLDLSRAEVCDYILKAMENLLRGDRIQYIKWDANRIHTDCFSSVTPEGEVNLRYYRGLYGILKRLTEEFPTVLFESCASGGNRADLGMVRYMPQFWASDDTDALCRTEIQRGYSYGYPQSVLGCHVSSCPNHQTLRCVPLESRFQVACFGLLGYELDVSSMSAEEKKIVKNQIAWYKKYRTLLQFGRQIRVTPEFTLVVSPDGTKAVGLHYVSENRPNRGPERLYARGLLPNEDYLLTNREIAPKLQDFGTLVNAISPVPIKPGTMVEELAAKLVKLSPDRQNVTASGAFFMEAGFPLSQGFSGTGFEERTRVMPDDSSRLYCWEKQ